MGGLKLLPLDVLVLQSASWIAESCLRLAKQQITWPLTLLTTQRQKPVQPNAFTNLITTQLDPKKSRQSKNLTSPAKYQHFILRGTTKKALPSQMVSVIFQQISKLPYLIGTSNKFFISLVKSKCGSNKILLQKVPTLQHLMSRHDTLQKLQRNSNYR